jgi:hypothetical protein
MNSTVKKCAMAAMLLGAAGIQADVLIDDFTGGETHNMLTKGGDWLADSDQWPAIGGSSRVRPLTDTNDLVKGDAFAGDNISMAYAEDFSITSRLYVSADVSPTKAWAYAGWIMDFLQPDTTGTGKKAYELMNWEKKHEVDISTCDALEMTLQFETDRIIWIDLFSPYIEKTDPAAPQLGWRYTGTGALETKRFSLKGVTGPAMKWKDDAHKFPFTPDRITRLRILYEGLKKGSATAAYDTEGHILKIKKVTMVGGACQVRPNPNASNTPLISGLRHARPADGFAMDMVSGRLQFGSLAQIGKIKVTVRNLSGGLMTEGFVDASHPSLDVSGLENGVYTIQAAGAGFHRSNTVTLLK